jgi:hypothetical protein
MCTDTYAPVCASNGVTYPNVCEREVAACKLGLVLTTVAEGACADRGVALRPMFFFFLLGRRSRERVRGGGRDIACGEVCTDDYAPVCASDGVTYGNACALARTRCTLVAPLEVVHTGACVEAGMSPIF